MLTTKTFRVPKRVRDQASYGLTEVESLESAPPEAFQVANFLLSGESLGPAVLRSINDYFLNNESEPLDTPVPKMYGGKAGREWASRCLAVLPTEAVTAATEPMDRVAWDLSDEEVEAILEWSRNAMAGEADKNLRDSDLLENDLLEALSVREESLALMEDDEEQPDEDEETPEEDLRDPIEILRDEIETALGLATKMDDSVEKLADALEDAVEQGGLFDEEEEPEEPEEPDDESDSTFEMRMVQSALAEIGALPDAEDDVALEEFADADFAVEAAEARERMMAAMLARQRSKAMARMASSRITLAAEGPGPVATEVIEKAAEGDADASADAGPKAPGPDHHSKRQVRDWHGRFAKVGARVRSKAGNLGYVKSVDNNGQLVIEGDDGKTHTVDPKTIEVVTKPSPAHLPEPLPLIEDPKARLSAYLEWARDQMGVGGGSK
jgi:hypothetical protein